MRQQITIIFVDYTGTAIVGQWKKGPAMATALPILILLDPDGGPC